MTSDIMKVYVKEILIPYYKETVSSIPKKFNKRGLLLLDNFSAHKDSTVKTLI